MPIDYEAASQTLSECFTSAETSLLNQSGAPGIPPDVAASSDVLFTSSTQAFRETLVGCAIARLQDKAIDIRLPYVGAGEGAFNGRTLDERVVNPFFKDRRIPSSRGPYLSVFRRSVRFVAETGTGLRDQLAFKAFLECVGYLERAEDDEEIVAFITYLMYRFAELREAANVQLSKIQRFSLDQYRRLIGLLLETPSGGRLPMFVVIAALKAVKRHFNAPWEVEWQKINVADRASGAVGDVTLIQDEKTILAAEITERPIDRARVVATFTTKVAPAAIGDYLFFVLPEPSDDAKSQAYQYFAQGHEMNFVQVAEWAVMVLATIGRDGRAVFNTELLTLLDDVETPKTVKVAWNDLVNRVISGTTTL